MLERVAITASVLRIACVALAVWLGAQVDRFAPVILVPAGVASMRASEVRDATPVERPSPAIRTRAPGLNHRFLTRDVVAPRAQRQYPQ